MSDEQDNGTQTEAPARGRPKGSRNRPTRRNYVAELGDLQGRVDSALRILAECEHLDNAVVGDKLIRIAIKTLQGEV